MRGKVRSPGKIQAVPSVLVGGEGRLGTSEKGPKNEVQSNGLIASKRWASRPRKAEGLRLISGVLVGSSRNRPCECGSGKKAKRCCDSAGGRELQLLEPGPVPQHVKDATDRMMLEEGYTAEASAELLSIDRRLRRRAARRAGMWLPAIGLAAIAAEYRGPVRPIRK